MISVSFFCIKRIGSFYLRVAALGIVIAAGWPHAPVRALDVALELVLAVDCSASVDSNEYMLQMRGIADAFRSADVIQTIGAAAPNGIAITLVQWAGSGMQAQAIPWHRVHDPSSAESFAVAVEKAPRLVQWGPTAIGDALWFSLGLFANNGFSGLRRTIDLSGDGKSNQGEYPSVTRLSVIEAGVVINGLAILNDDGKLDQYYRQYVIGGDRAFVIKIKDFNDFASAIRRKLVREIGNFPVSHLSTQSAGRQR